MKSLTYFWYIFVVITYVNALGLDKARYDNYRVYKFKVENNVHIQLLTAFEDYADGYRLVSGSNKVGNEVQIIVPPHKFGEFGEFDVKFHLNAEIITWNLQEAIDKEAIKSKPRKDAHDWKSYSTLEEINAWMDSVVALFPETVSPFVVGKSYEGRVIRGVKVNTGGLAKKSIFFESMIHSYEWIAPATTTWILNELLTSSDVEIQKLADRYEWYFVPVFNVDGYAYTWSTDRMWRKSRKPTKSLLCKGADLNRNWDVNFGDSSPNNPCHSRYGGDSVFSEPENKQLSEFLRNIPRLVGYFSVHALGQYVMFPYGFTKENIETYDTLYEIGLKGAQALTAKHGKVYEFGALNKFFDLLSGTSLDWVSLNVKPNISFTFELRPTRAEENVDGLGLLLPPEQIVDVSEEIFAAIVTILQEAILIDFA